MKAFKRAFVTLAAGSAFMHGSHTILGGKYDVYMDAVISYLSYREIITKLNGTSNVLLCLGKETCTPPLQLASQMAFFSSEKPLDEWRSAMAEVVSGAPIDKTVELCAGIVFFFFLLIFGNFFGRHALIFILDQAENIFDMDDSFLREQLLPEFCDIMKHISLPIEKRVEILLIFAGMEIKFLWAFTW